ncbi:MAG: molecular chaperone DnaJ [candidate division WS1 bacterium]|nr:molecular chaperone DnaJ [candidate division WS1 bacterium]
MRKMAECEHCGGKKTCTISGGRSCVDCLRAAGQGRRSHAAVRCSFCGGRGFVMVEVEDEDPKEESEAVNDEEEAQ